MIDCSKRGNINTAALQLQLQLQLQSFTLKQLFSEESCSVVVITVQCNTLVVWCSRQLWCPRTDSLYIVRWATRHATACRDHSLLNVLTPCGFRGLEIPGALLGYGLWAHLRPGSMKDNFASTETGTGTQRSIARLSHDYDWWIVPSSVHQLTSAVFTYCLHEFLSFSLSLYICRPGCWNCVVNVYPMTTWRCYYSRLVNILLLQTAYAKRSDESTIRPRWSVDRWNVSRWIVVRALIADEVSSLNSSQTNQRSSVLSVVVPRSPGLLTMCRSRVSLLFHALSFQFLETLSSLVSECCC